jgi:hypothetical protein
MIKNNIFKLFYVPAYSNTLLPIKMYKNVHFSNVQLKVYILYICKMILMNKSLKIIIIQITK